MSGINRAIRIADLLRQGRADEALALFHEQEMRRGSPESFVAYMDRIIADSGMSRTRIIQRSGLSRDYMYKVLRGDKTTSERDYIIAFCMAMKLDLDQTQHALELYPFPTLSEEDFRSSVIMAAIQKGAGIDELNGWLEKFSQPLLRTSPDMPAAKIRPERSTLSSEKPVYSGSERGYEPLKKRSAEEMNITGTKTSVEQTGLAPVDLAVGAEYEFVTDEGRTLYAQAFFQGELSLFAINEVSMYAERYQTESKEHEHYESLAEAGESAYFSLFLELDRLADSELARKLSQIDDTKNYGARSGTWHDSSGKVPFAEVFNWREPEKYEYVQVRRTAEGYRYSASHKSYYLRYELGPLYNVYFPDAEPEAYLFETDSLESLGSYGYLLPAFLSILTVLTADMEDYASAPGKNGESMAE